MARERRASASGGEQADRVLAAAAFDAFGGELSAEPSDAGFPEVFGTGRTIELVDLSGAALPLVGDRGEPHPALELVIDVDLVPGGEPAELWFRFGLAANGPSRYDPDGLRGRLPRAASTRLPEAAREVPWHAAVLTGGACRDEVLGGHTLDQGSTYAFDIGMNGAARDPVQHALPLVYLEPDLALSVLRNTCAWATPDGDLPYALDGSKKPFTQLFTPSDQNLYALWLATEYLAATGDVGAFDAPVPYHPAYAAAPVSLREHLLRQQEFLLTGVGRGVRGHLRMR
nr:hypothetical protein [Micromonospora sp. DSM 115978]